MLKLWEWNTKILAVQAVVFVAARYLFDAPMEVAFSFAIAVALFATIIALVFDAVVLFATPTASVVAFSAAVAFSVAATANALAAAAIFAAVSVFAAAIFAAAAKKGGAEEDSWALFIAALQLGIGTVLGGILLLYFKLHKQSHALAR